MTRLNERKRYVRLMLFGALALGCSSVTVSATLEALHWDAPMPPDAAQLA